MAFGHTPATPVEEKPLLHWEQLTTSTLLEAIEKIDSDMPLSSSEEQAVIAFGAGTSAGGARPKLTVRRDDGIWLAKLKRHDDRLNIVRIEAAMLDLAQLCGISVPEHRLERIHRLMSC